jgi:hypothetical protein
MRTRRRVAACARSLTHHPDALAPVLVGALRRIHLRGDLLHSAGGCGLAHGM